MAISVDLVPEELSDVLESLDYSIRTVREWHEGPQGSPVTDRLGAEKVARLERLRDKLREARRGQASD